MDNLITTTYITYNDSLTNRTWIFYFIVSYEFMIIFIFIHSSLSMLLVSHHGLGYNSKYTIRYYNIICNNCDNILC